MTLKKAIPFFALALCVFASCKKNNSSSNGNYHFTATIDGKAQTFNVSPLATIATNSGYSIIGIEGFTAASSTTQVLALSWTNTALGTIFTTGTYNDTASKYAIGAIYNPTATESYGAGSGVTGDLTGTNATGINRLKIIITSLDSTAVKGTFSGDFFFNGDPTEAKKTVTNGDFYVPWKK
jgi:hypothetical protein